MIMHAIVPSSLVTGGISYQTTKFGEYNIGATKVRKNHGAKIFLSFNIAIEILVFSLKLSLLIFRYQFFASFLNFSLLLLLI